VNMNLLELIKNAPVEWKTIDEISNKISSGGTPKTGISEYYDGDIPWLRTQEVDFGEIWDTAVKITEAGVKNSSANWIPANCIIIAMYGATVGKIGINKIPMTTNQACANVEINDEIANYRYVFHYLFSQYEYIKSLGSGSQTNISAQIVKNLKIPIPTKEIQEKIVEVLDKMTKYVTELTAELTAELTMRKQQYAYYRDLLLSEESLAKVGFEWKVLKEVCEINRGKRLVKSELDKTGEYPVYQNSMIPLGYYDKYNFCGDSTFIVSAGSAGEIGYMSSDFWAADDVYVFQTNEILKSRFLYHFLLTKKNVISSKVRRASVPRLSRTAFENLKIPIPPLPEQARIVKILDKFDTLINSISEGLPKEIELRQKQYEHYRNLLFEFNQNK